MKGSRRVHVKGREKYVEELRKAERVRYRNQVRRIFQGERPPLYNIYPREASKDKTDLAGRIQCLSLSKHTSKRVEVKVTLQGVN